MKDIMDLIARVIIGAIFVLEAIHIIKYFKEIRLQIADIGLSRFDHMILYSILFILITGGLLILLGYRVFLGGILILVYWLPDTFLEYDWWNEPEPQKRIESLLFMRSLAVAAGVLLIMAHGSGKYSIRRLFANTKVPKKYR